ncbi:hypothetical protein FF38_14435 [Lucilia cuprina]|uniref:Uncharacterized protein n=1 Tax=Lucilia cuprina TaxID=7375 RepID=A0A0L0BU46_LUCCU|nr:hypothetical protein FF38_14435 [Lucilia cuprina]
MPTQLCVNKVTGLCGIKTRLKMLKWAVNGPRQSYTQNGDNNLDFPVTSGSSQQQQRRRLKRKSSDLSTLRPKTSWHDKENQYTSTPLHPTTRSFSESPSRKMDSLKDLSNIVPEMAFTSPLRLSTNKISPLMLKTPENTQTRKNLPNNYASTLPTFDVEYSPCALIPGPILALRGVGIPDSYFEKPRYITPHPKEMLNNINEEPSLETKTLQKQVESNMKYPVYMEESTLSSTKMGDVTLERMIDAILESNRKDRKSQKTQKPPQQQHSNMSPTYTPAEDPASDLHEVWDSEKARYRQKEQKFRAGLTKKSLFNEREICSPQLQETLDPGQLRRQGGLRRKRKITQITASVMSSAQKLLGKGPHAQTPFMHSHNLRKVFEAELIHDEIHPRKLLRNLSPDSGHNSSSDYEEEEEDSTLECMTDDNKTLDNTKRRLSFSLQNLNKT